MSGMAAWELIDRIEDSLESDDPEVARNQIAKLVAAWRETATNEEQGR